MIETRYRGPGADNEASAKEAAIRLLDSGEPDQNPGLGYLKVKDIEAEEIE